MIPFSPPRIDDKICNEVIAALKSGWITTGPRTKAFEKKITEYCGNKNTLCLNSATAGLEIMLRWFGVKEGDDLEGVYLPDEFDNIYVDSIENVAAVADVILLAAPAKDIREVAYHLGDVRKKVIIDISGNIEPKPEEYIYTVKAARSITGAAHLVKSFNCAGFDNLLAPSFEKDAVDMFVAGDSQKAKEMTKLLAKDLGFANCYDFGDQETIPLLEDMARCWHNLAIKQKMGQKIAFKIVKR